MSIDVNQIDEPKKSWIYRLPLQLACFMLAICLVSSQINPCDATSVSLGYSLTFILIAMGIGFFVAIDSVLCLGEIRPDRLLVWLTAACTVFSTWLWFCTTYVPGLGNARFAYNGCWQWIAEGILMLAVARLCLRFRITGSLLALMLACAAGTVAHAGYKYFISMPAFRARFAADPNSFFKELDIVAGSAEAMQFTNRLESLEPLGPFALTNSLAGLMAAWLVFLAVSLSSQRASFSAQSKVQKAKLGSLILGAVLMVGFFVTLLLTKSRSAWLASLVCLLAACMVHPALRQQGWSLANRFRISVAAITVVCVVAIAGVLIRDPMIVAEAGKSMSYRLDYWRGAVALIEAKPWTGYGVANFQENYNRVKVITASESPADPHNFLLETAAAGGLPLLFFLVSILVILFLKMLELSRLPALEAASPFQSKAPLTDGGRPAIALGGLVGCVGILLFGIFLSDADSLASSLFFVMVAISVFLMVERVRWIVNNQECATVCLIAASVILIHLLASGGWMQPGLMNTVCVLVGLAFGMNHAGSLAWKRNNPAGQACGILESHAFDRWIVRAFRLPKWESKMTYLAQGAVLRTGFLSTAGLLFVVFVAVDFARTMCLPVLASSAVMSTISDKDIAVQEPSEWLRFIQADPFDPNLPSHVANQCVELLRRNNLSSKVRQKYADLFEACCREFIRRAPNQWMSYAQCGTWNAILVDSEPVRDQGNSSSILKKELAYQYFSRAAESYPNSASTQLQAAIGAAWCGRYNEAKQYRSKVESIERETPHLDRKLAAVVVYFPKELENSTSPLDGQARSGQQPGYAKGEPILQWLRTNVR